MPLAGRCSVAMNELYWGDFGQYFRHHPGERSRVLLETAQHKAVARLHRDAGVGPHNALALQGWLDPVSRGGRDSHFFEEGLAWMGEKHQLTDLHPIGYLCTQWHLLDDKSQTPNTIQRLLPAQRLAAMVTDVFFEDAETQYAD